MTNELKISLINFLKKVTPISISKLRNNKKEKFKTNNIKKIDNNGIEFQVQSISLIGNLTVYKTVSFEDLKTITFNFELPKYKEAFIDLLLYISTKELENKEFSINIKLIFENENEKYISYNFPENKENFNKEDFTKIFEGVTQIKCKIIFQ